MIRQVIGGSTPHDDREQYGSVLRQAFPLGLHSFEGLDLRLGSEGAGLRQGTSNTLSSSPSAEARC